MTLIELIGFMITMVAFFLLIAKQARDERRRRQNPEAYEEEAEQEHQETIKHFLRSLNIEIPEDTPPPKKELPPVPKVLEPEEIEAPALKRKSLFRDPYALHKPFEHGEKRKKQQSRVGQMLKGKDSLRQAVILKEVLGAPKAFE